MNSCWVFRIVPLSVHIVDLDFLPHLYISSSLKIEAGESIKEEGDSSAVAINVVVSGSGWLPLLCLVGNVHVFRIRIKTYRILC